MAETFAETFTVPCHRCRQEHIVHVPEGYVWRAEFCSHCNACVQVARAASAAAEHVALMAKAYYGERPYGVPQ